MLGAWWQLKRCFASGRCLARLAGLEPTASSSAGMRSIHLSYKRVSPKPTTVKIGPSSGNLLSYWLVPKEGLEPTRPFRALHPECSASTNSATSACSRCLPDSSDHCSPVWWAVEGSNLGPLACEASALTTELTARLLDVTPEPTVLNLWASDPVVPVVATTGLEPVT